MRTHLSAEQKSVVAVEKAPVPAAPTVPASHTSHTSHKPAPAKPLPSSPFAFASPFKHAA